MYITCLAVLGWAGIGLTSTSSWLGWPKEPIKWVILYHVLSCSVFKWGAGWRRGFCYSGASWASGGENTVCCLGILSVLLVIVFFSPCHSIKLFSSQPTSFAFFLLILLPIRPRRLKKWESNCMVLSLLQIEAKPQHESIFKCNKKMTKLYLVYSSQGNLYAWNIKCEPILRG